MDRLIIWNVRGINCQQKHKEVRYVIPQKKVGLIRLLETKVKAHNMGKLYLNLFKSWCFTSNSSFHKGGRIIIGGNLKSFHVNIIACSSQLIHCEIKPMNGASFIYVHYHLCIK